MLSAVTIFKTGAKFVASQSESRLKRLVKFAVCVQTSDLHCVPACLAGFWPVHAVGYTFCTVDVGPYFAMLIKQLNAAAFLCTCRFYTKFTFDSIFFSSKVKKIYQGSGCKHLFLAYKSNVIGPKSVMAKRFVLIQPAEIEAFPINIFQQINSLISHCLRDLCSGV